MSIATTGNESEQHIRAKQRLHGIASDMGFIVDYEISTGVTETEIGKRNFTVDILAFWTNARTGDTKKIAFEVHGFKGHNTTRQIARDKNRDRGHLTKGIYTVRIEMKDLVGRKKQDNNTIGNEIWYQLGLQGFEQ